MLLWGVIGSTPDMRYSNHSNPFPINGLSGPQTSELSGTRKRTGTSRAKQAANRCPEVTAQGLAAEEARLEVCER